MDETTYAPQREVEKATLRVIAADRYAREEDPHADAESEHADELLAHACRDLVDAVNAGDPREWPVGWACGEVGTGWPNGTEGGPVNTEPCRFRPDHEGPHDWSIAEAAAEAVQLRAELRRMRQVVESAKRWRAQFSKPVHFPRMAALIAAVDALSPADPVTPLAARQDVAGPWVAVLADRHGDVYPTFAEAAKVLPDDAEMMIRIVRGTAMPVEDEIDGGLRVAQQYNVDDLAYETDAYLTDPDDLSQGAEVLYARAQAMADGLNAAEQVPA